MLHCVLLIRVFWQNALADALYSCFSSVNLVVGVSLSDIIFCAGRPKTDISRWNKAHHWLWYLWEQDHSRFFAAKREAVSVSFKKLVVTWPRLAHVSSCYPRNSLECMQLFFFFWPFHFFCSFSHCGTHVKAPGWSGRGGEEEQKRSYATEQIILH